MVFDSIKKFLDKKKNDAKFKKAGTGHTLASSSSSNQQQPSASNRAPYVPTWRQAPSPGAVNAQRAAAEAAQKRSHTGPGHELTTSQKAIRAQARRELEKETNRMNVGAAGGRSKSPETVDHPLIIDEAVGGIFFTCDLLPEDVILSRDGMHAKIEEFLRELFSEEPLYASSLMLFTLNSNKDKRQLAIDTLCKYLENVIAHPEEEKFRKIKIGNKAFEERVLSAKGGREFLVAAGFEEKILPSVPNAAPEPYLFLEADTALVEQVETAKAILMTGEPVPIKLYRNPRVLNQAGSRSLAEVSIPDSFFERTSSEVKDEVYKRAEEMDKMMSLRTKEMRDRDAAAGTRKYKYCLIRIKFRPWSGDQSALMLQGTFGAKEQLSEVREFVRGYLDADAAWAPFILRGPSGAVLDDSQMDKSIQEAGLAPAGLVTFEWDPEILQQWQKENIQQKYLRQEWADTATSI